MCGVFGFVRTLPGEPDSDADRRLIEALLLLSESRGKDASGVAFADDDGIAILKRPIAASGLIRSAEFDRFVNSTRSFRAVIGHARMETNGTFARSCNNQPVVKDGCVTIHNGIIVNDSQLWADNPDLKREYEVDTEILNALLRKRLRSGLGLESALDRTLADLEGAYSIASFLEDFHHVVLATNTGSLYYLASPRHFLFASERFFLRSLVAQRRIAADPEDIQQLAPGTWLLLDTHDLRARVRPVDGQPEPGTIVANAHSRPIRVVTEAGADSSVPSPPTVSTTLVRSIDAGYERNRRRIDALRRCSRCILPETMPFIEFDAAGICSFCRSYRPMQLHGVDAFERIVAPHRGTDGRPDCIIPFSGGRDSSYGVWYAKNVLKMHPITFTYDWGMVTDLARRNIARVCGRLGVENILISADIAMKRRNIRKNVSAWLKSPELGTVPLFMAGDKHFLSLVNRVRRETGVELDIWLGNRLENTQFKVGFCGIAPGSDERRIDSLSLTAKLRLLLYYAKHCAQNPRYLNTSVVDTLAAFYSYYFEPRPHFHLLFDYIPWSERDIEAVLFREFDWETAPDTASTWRIGDGTAAFYNFIYYTIAGFSEVDTFRSNQIREGMLTREAALELTQRENAPRVDSMGWYLSTIGIDMESCVRVIDDVPKLYAR